MFLSDVTIKYIKETVDEVWEIYRSVNQPNIALPDRSPEPTWAFVIALKKDKKMRVYIYLFQEAGRQGFFYTYEDGDVELIKAKNVFNEALDFTGSMGFIMEKTELGVSKEEREKLIKAIPAFMQDTKAYKGSTDEEEVLLESIIYDDGTEHSVPDENYKEGQKNISGGNQWFAKILSAF
ncbi:MAG: hypothetical protein M1381_07245 [Deltaproteobacteria bacterium]|nr:hypothetical protein [Deltaproteobacteria bacterium]